MLKKKATAPPVKRLVLGPKKTAPVKKALPTKKMLGRAPVDGGNGSRPTKLSAAKKSGAAPRKAAAPSLNRPGWGDDIDKDFARGFRPKADSETVVKFLDPLPYANVLIHWLDEKDRPQGRRSYPCLGEGGPDPETCPLCALGDEPNAEHRYNIIVISDVEPVHHSFTPSKTIHNKIKAFATSPRTKPLPRRYYLLAREGSTKTNTRYELTDYRRDEDVLDDYPGYKLPTPEEIAAIKKFTHEDFEKEVVSYDELLDVAQEITGE